MYFRLSLQIFDNRRFRIRKKKHIIEFDNKKEDDIDKNYL